ncbi:MAG: hypothetical protein HZA52_10555 [Planctomycetes bacterium]|nr:hypothetical protein [Planctomycetota bacterium]
MVQFTCQIDAEASAVHVKLSDEDGHEQSVQFAFDPRTGRYDCPEFADLEEVLGTEWVANLESHVRKLVDQAVMARRRSERDDPWGF